MSASFYQRYLMVLLMLFCAGANAVGKKLQIDCHSTQNIENLGSNDLITINVLDENREVIRRVLAMDGNGNPVVRDEIYQEVIDNASCEVGFKAVVGQVISFGQGDVIAFSKSIATNPAYIQIFISGSDAFYIDRLMFVDRHGNGTKWGKNEGRGWCLSRDPSDANKGWKNHVSACYACIEFNVSNGKADGACPPPNSTREMFH